MNNMNNNRTVNTCRDCADFYDCEHNLEQNDIVCAYFLPRYKRIMEIRTVGELITTAMKLKQTYVKVYNDYLKEQNIRLLGRSI